MDPLDDDHVANRTKRHILTAWAAEKGVTLYSLDEVAALGRTSPRPPNPPSPSDPITINYTSGTTGFPKGVLLTHGNCIAACSAAMTSNMYQSGHDVAFSYLPLAHIYARVAENAAMWGGAAIGYFHGNIAELLDDIKELRPTHFISVPRLYNRIWNAIKESAVEAPGFKGTLSRHVLAAKLETLKTTGSNTHALYDLYVLVVR